MSNLFEYLKYSICTNIIHINHNRKIVRFLYKLMKTRFHRNLYEPMKPNKFVM